MLGTLEGSSGSLALPLTHQVPLGKCLELTSFIVSMRASILFYAASWNDLWASGFRAVCMYKRELEKQEGNDKLKGCCCACSGYSGLAFGVLFIVNSYSFLPQQCRVKSKLFSTVKDH